MSIESGDNFGFGFGAIRQIGPEMETALLADSGDIRAGLHDAEFAARHDPSLPPHLDPVDFKRHHYRKFVKLDLERFS